jgi:cytochrome c peroxidase
MIDYGLGEMVAQFEAAYGEPLPAGSLSYEPDGLGQGGTKTVVTDEAGKFKVMSLRNIARTAPYGHNGFFPTLYSIVHFYNTRDFPWPGETPWPVPEVVLNMNIAELGDLGLTFDEEQKIVLFLETLTDK